MSPFLYWENIRPVHFQYMELQNRVNTALSCLVCEFMSFGYPGTSLADSGGQDLGEGDVKTMSMSMSISGPGPGDRGPGTRNLDTLDT